MIKKLSIMHSIVFLVLMLFFFSFIPRYSVFAARTMSDEDFTKMSGKYKVNFISDSSYDVSSFHYANMIYEKKKPTKILKTYRGVTLGDSKKTVFRKYGKKSLKKVKYKSDNLYYAFFEIDHDPSAYLLKRMANYVDYYYQKDSDEYRLRFYFDKNGIVRMIAYFKNYDLL